MKANDLIKEIYDFEMENGFPPSKIHLSEYQIESIRNEFKLFACNNLTESTYPCMFQGIPEVCVAAKQVDW